MPNALKARFDISALRLRLFQADMNHRTGSVSPVVITGGRERSLAVGEAQQVMFLIGEVANQGEDVLVDVERIT